MKTSDLTKEAIKKFNWYIHNVSTNRTEAIKYAQKIYDHALECNYITEFLHKELCLKLPFETYLKNN